MGTFGTLILIVVLGAIYLLPTIIVVMNKGKQSKGPAILVNILFGWSIIGWFASLIMAVSKDTYAPSVVINNKQSGATANAPSDHR